MNFLKLYTSFIQDNIFLHLIVTNLQQTPSLRSAIYCRTAIFLIPRDILSQKIEPSSTAFFFIYYEQCCLIYLLIALQTARYAVDALARNVCATSVERTFSNESLVDIVRRGFVRQSSNLLVLLGSLDFIASIRSSRDRFVHSRTDLHLGIASETSSIVYKDFQFLFYTNQKEGNISVEILYYVL